MLFAFLAALLQAAAPPAPPPAAVPPAGDDIVVVASRQKCGIAIANRVLSSREFDRRSAEWAAGVPVRVIVPPGSDYRCLSKIMFKLADRGVTRAAFVDR